MLNKQNLPPMEDQGVELGDKLRQCRKDANLTMQYVAENARLTKGFISQVERGITLPSLSSLRSIASVLGRPLSEFLDQPAGSSGPTRQTERVNYSIGEGTVSYERLSTNFPGSVVRSVIVHEPPGYRNPPISHEGEELFYILKGEISIEVEGELTILREGDSMHIDSSRTHATWNHTNETASFMWTGTMDVFGEDTNDPIHKSKSTGK